MPQVNVFLRKHNPLVDTPPHRCSKNFAATLSATFPRLVRYDRATLTLQVLTSEAWSAIKARLRPKTVGVLVENVIIQDSGMSLMLSYPPMGQESNARARQRELWLGAERF